MAAKAKATRLFDLWDLAGGVNHSLLCDDQLLGGMFRLFNRLRNRQASILIGHW